MQFRLVVNCISSNVDSAPDAMGNSISEDPSLLEMRVRGATVQSLEGLRQRLRDAARGDPLANLRTIGD